MNKEAIRKQLTGRSCTVQIAATREYVANVISDVHIVRDEYDQDENEGTTHIVVLTLRDPVTFVDYGRDPRQGVTIESYCSAGDLGALQVSGELRNAQLRAIGHSSSARVNVTLR